MRKEPDRKHEEKPLVVAIGPFPPFVGGAAKNTAIICDALEKRGSQVTRLPTNMTRTRSEHKRSLGFLTDRFMGFLSNLGRLVFPRQDSQTTAVYLVPDGGLGVTFAIFYALASAARFPRLVVHHRSYNHIRKRSRLMAVLMKIAPSKTLHVFLDPVMEQRFKAVYSAEIKSTYVPNAATCDVASQESTALIATNQTITIGFLSNLVEDKGFDVVAEAFPRIRERLGPAVRFLLAGRPVRSRNAARLVTLRQRLGDHLEYAGELAGPAKVDFFRACDVFVFPTRFAQEAQPNVLYEAMAGGAAIVATRWAGIPWILDGTVHRLIDAGPTCADELVEAVVELVTSCNFGASRSGQLDAFRAKKSDADARYSALIEVLLDTAVS